MYLYPEFFRRFGVSKLNHLMTPRYGRLEQLQLPRNSALFYIPDSELEDGPGLDNIYLRDIKRMVPMIHIEDLTRHEGSPRIQTVLLNNVIRKYHLKHRKYRWIQDLSVADRDQMVPLVVNMSLMGRKYRYMRNIYTEWNKWRNQFGTTIDTMLSLIENTERQLFMEVTMPTKLPPLTTLRVAEEEFGNGPLLEYKFEGVRVGTESLRGTELEMDGLSVGMEQITSAVLKNLDGPDAFFIAEFWKWLGEHRGESMLVKLSGHYDRINLIVRNGLYWTVVNLGVLDQWRKTPDKETIEGVKRNDDGLSAKDLRIRVIKFFIQVYALTADAGSPEVAAAIADATTEVVATTNGEVTTAVKVPDAVDTVDTGKDVASAARTEDAVEAEIQRLTETTAEMATVQARDPFLEVSEAPEDSIREISNRLAEEGSISAAEYARFQKLATAYKDIQTTDGEGKTVKLGELAVVKPEMLVLEKAREYKVPENVFDTSMGESSLEKFDRHYVKKVLHRDIASMVTNIQHAGVCVTGYEVERVESILGSADQFTVKLQPLKGKPSTLSFKIPVVDDDGVYQSNGIRYRMRFQRGD